MSQTKYCMNCFKSLKGNEEICPSCKMSVKAAQVDNALKYNTLLQNRYLMGRSFSSNSEGFTYNALDKLDDVRVTIREFFPIKLAVRDAKTGSITPHERAGEVFDKFFNMYLNMAKGLISLKDCPSIITVRDMFWENNTAYIVYEYINAPTLREYVKENGAKLEWQKAMNLMLSGIDSFSTMHSKGVKHLGISPDTLLVTQDNKLVLTSFCTEPVRRINALITPDLVVGAAAYEQHVRTLECSEITDVYGFCACTIFALTGELPPGADYRANDGKMMIPKDLIKNMPRPMILALATGLQVQQKNRTSSFKRLKTELTSNSPIIEQSMEVRTIRDIPQGKKGASANNKIVSPTVWMIASFAVTAVVLFFVLSSIIQSGTLFSNVTDAIDDSLNDVSAAEYIKAPDMVGDNYEDWLGEIAMDNVYDFTINIESQIFSDEVGDGRIVSQNPLPDGNVERGGTINVVVSLGKEIRALPNISGLKFSDAIVILEEEGFVVLPEESTSHDIPAGNVMWYKDYNSGEELPYGTTITVYVSIGTG